MGAGALGAIAGPLLGMATGALDRAENFRYQRKIMKHQVRWRVQDLRAAGLNPLLAVSGGLAAGGAAGPNVTSRPADVAGALKAEKEGSRASAQAELASNQVDLVRNQAEAAETQAMLNRANAARAAAEASRIAMDERRAAAEAQLRELEAARAAAEAQFYEENPSFRKWEKWSDLIGRATGAARDVRPYVERRPRPEPTRARGRRQGHDRSPHIIPPRNRR